MRTSNVRRTSVCPWRVGVLVGGGGVRVTVIIPSGSELSRQSTWYV